MTCLSKLHVQYQQLPRPAAVCPLLCQLLLRVEVNELLLSLVPALPDVADPAVDQARGAVRQLQGGAHGSTVVVAAQDDGLDLVATTRQRAVKPGGVCRLLVLLCRSNWWSKPRTLRLLTAYSRQAMRLRSVCMAWLPTLRCTKISPGASPRIWLACGSNQDAQRSQERA